jgi:antitoxin YefM
LDARGWRNNRIRTTSVTETSRVEETAYLLRSPTDAERLIKSIGNLRAGKTKTRQLIEE